MLAKKEEKNFSTQTKRKFAKVAFSFAAIAPASSSPHLRSLSCGSLHLAAAPALTLAPTAAATAAAAAAAVVTLF